MDIQSLFENKDSLNSTNSLRHWSRLSDERSRLKAVLILPGPRLLSIQIDAATDLLIRWKNPVIRLDRFFAAVPTSVTNKARAVVNSFLFERNGIRFNTNLEWAWPGGICLLTKARHA